jgi:hypothetical protein
MSFDALPVLQVDEPQVYAEDGIRATARNGALGSFSTRGSFHMDDSGSAYPSSVVFALETGRRFDPLGLELLPIGNFLVPNLEVLASEVCDWPFCTPYDNLLLEGFRDGEPVASQALYMGTENRRLDFAPAFSALDELRVTARRPEPLGLPGVCPDAPCAHFDLDDLELAPVPLPAAAWFLLTALAALAGVRLGLESRDRP